MISRIIIIVLFVGFSANSFAAKSKNTRVFDLTSAVRYAINYSPKLDNSRRRFKVSGLNLKNSLASFAPSADVSSSHTLSKAEGSNAQKSSGVGLSISQNLYNNSQDITNYKISKLNHETQRINFGDECDQLIRSVVTDYLNLSLQRKLYAIQQNNMKTLKKEYTSALKKYREGLKTQKDVVRFRNQIQRTEISLLRAKNSIGQAKKQLLTNMGYNLLRNPIDQVEIKILNLPDIRVSSIPTITPALERQPQYKNFILQKKIDSLNVYLAKRSYWPQATVSGGANYGGGSSEKLFGAFGNKKTWDASVTLNLSYNLFDAGTRRRNVDIAREGQLQSINNIYSGLLSLKQTLENLMLDLEQNKLSYELSRKLRESEFKNYKTVEQMYRNGKISYLDLSTAINDLFSARSDYMSVRYALEQNLYSYYYYKGNIYEKVFK